MDRESVITHLQIIHTWAEFARERNLQFFTPKHLKDIAQWADDAIELLKEQEAKTGHWVSVDDGDIVAIDNEGSPERACFCSECEKYLIASDEYAVYGIYCPYCGSKMEGR